MNTKELAKQIRITSLKMCHKAKASHIGGCLSCADILAVLYNDILKDGDRLIISKGHCAAAVYSVLALTGKIPMEWLDRYCQDGAELGGHVTYGILGVEVSTGSLGHGLSIGCGMALANPDKRVFVLMSDGELNEGSTWEATGFASEYALSNLMVIVDYNELQSFMNSIMMREVVSRWRGFRWATYKINGHDLDKLKGFIEYFDIRRDRDEPYCLIAHTIKGKGVFFMHNKLEWHYKYPNKEELKLALEELNGR